MTTTIALIFAALSVAASARQSQSLRSRQDNTCIVNTVATPSVSDVEASINQWNTDVDTVNAFLNVALTLDATTLSVHAQAALINAQDEPCQLMTLANAGIQGAFNTDAFTCAVNDLMVVFGDHVIDNLNTIIANPSDTAAAHAAVGDINFFRCCNVLPDADVLWLDAAADEGLVGTVQITANRPDACSSIDCSGVTQCKTKDNGSFGRRK